MANHSDSFIELVNGSNNNEFNIMGMHFRTYVLYNNRTNDDVLFEIDFLEENKIWICVCVSFKAISSDAHIKFPSTTNHLLFLKILSFEVNKNALGRLDE